MSVRQQLDEPFMIRNRRKRRRKLNRTIDEIIADTDQIDSQRSNQIYDAYQSNPFPPLVDPKIVQLFALAFVIAGFLT